MLRHHPAQAHPQQPMSLSYTLPPAHMQATSYIVQQSNGGIPVSTGQQQATHQQLINVPASCSTNEVRTSVVPNMIVQGVHTNMISTAAAAAYPTSALVARAPAIFANQHNATTVTNHNHSNHHQVLAAPGGGQQVVMTCSLPQFSKTGDYATLERIISDANYAARFNAMTYAETLHIILRTDNKSTPIHELQARARIVQLILSVTPTAATIADTFGALPLHHSIRFGSDMHIKNTVIQSLLRAHPHGLTIHDDAGWTPLHIACIEEFQVDCNCLRTLLKAEHQHHNLPAVAASALSMQDMKGWTPLHHLCSNMNKGYCIGLKEKIDVVLEVSPNALYVRAHDGLTPNEILRSSGFLLQQRQQQAMVNVNFSRYVVVWCVVISCVFIMLFNVLLMNCFTVLLCSV